MAEAGALGALAHIRIAQPNFDMNVCCVAVYSYVGMFECLADGASVLGGAHGIHMGSSCAQGF